MPTTHLKDAKTHKNSVSIEKITHKVSISWRLYRASKESQLEKEIQECKNNGLVVKFDNKLLNITFTPTTSTIKKMYIALSNLLAGLSINSALYSYDVDKIQNQLTTLLKNENFISRENIRRQDGGISRSRNTAH